jgi:murein DD-endopeptidase MepM/ murein hydrolase activator NlpD
MSNHRFPFALTSIPKGGDFGNKEAPRTNPHRGVDFAIAGGTPIPSATHGEVTFSGWTDVLGNVVVIKDPKDVYWGYCHMREASKLRVTQKVHCGDIVGLVGNTGSASRGAHLHFTCSVEPNGYKQGAVIDPISALERRIAADKKNVEIAKTAKAAQAPAPAEESAEAAPVAEPVAAKPKVAKKVK